VIESILQGRENNQKNEPLTVHVYKDTFIDILFLAENNDVFAAFSRGSVVPVNPYYFLLLQQITKQ